MKPEDIHEAQGMRTAQGIPSPKLYQFDNVATGDSFALSALDKDGQAWFIAADVCKALGLDRTATSRLDEDEKGVCSTHTLGGIQQVAIISESGLYSLIFRSRKELAKRFKKWVTSVVIPSIRKHGGYINGQEALSQPAQEVAIQAIQDQAQRVRAQHYEEKNDRREALRFIR
uniref:BRO, N-terminal n=1 Tax=Dechloromonas aromatica (strain RCB) TaxID=159087 RepID=Q47D35_DECAR